MAGSGADRSSADSERGGREAEGDGENFDNGRSFPPLAIFAVTVEWARSKIWQGEEPVAALTMTDWAADSESPVANKRRRICWAKVDEWKELMKVSVGDPQVRARKRVARSSSLIAKQERHEVG